MSDRIVIHDLHLRTIIGINPDERKARQDVLVNLTLAVDIRAAAASDDIDDAVNYRTITKRVIHLVESSRYYLVEKLATEIAYACLEEPGVERALVRVEKPGALRFARSVGVEIERSRSDLQSSQSVYISLGSNIEPEHNLTEAVRRLARRLRMVLVSPVYETQPVGKTEQPNFLNAALLARTELSANELKETILREIEDEQGRVRTQDKYAPRTIDLDIALYLPIAEGVERVVDPDILRQAHVARPLADLAPRLPHPETGQTLEEIAASLDDDSVCLRPDVDLWAALEQ